MHDYPTETLYGIVDDLEKALRAKDRDILGGHPYYQRPWMRERLEEARRVLAQRDWTRRKWEEEELNTLP